MLVIRRAYIRGGLYSGGAYIRDFTVFSQSYVHVPFSNLLTPNFMQRFTKSKEQSLYIFIERH